MDHTVIARKDQQGKPVEGTFEVARRGDARIGTRGWWGGSAVMSLETAEREVAKRNGAALSAQP